MEELSSVVTTINAGGVVGVLVLNLWAIFTGRLVVRWVHDDVVEDRNRWRTTALKATDNADRALMEAEKHYNALHPRSVGSTQSDATSTTSGLSAD